MRDHGRCVVVLLAGTAIACSGTEIGRVHFTSEGTAETEIDIDGNRDTELWVEQGPTQGYVHYDVEFLQSGARVLQTTCSLGTPTSGRGRRSGGGRSFARCAKLGKLPGGKTAVKVKLDGPGGPGPDSARIDLVITQK